MFLYWSFRSLDRRDTTDLFGSMTLGLDPCHNDPREMLSDIALNGGRDAIRPLVGMSP